MTIREVIQYVDAAKHNTCTREEKRSWLSRLDQLIHTRIHANYQGAQGPPPGYHPDTDMDTALLLVAPWDEMYLRYLEMQIDYLNGEIDRYNNSAALFDALFQGYAAWYHRNHMPKSSSFQNY